MIQMGLNLFYVFVFFSRESPLILKSLSCQYSSSFFLYKDSSLNEDVDILLQQVQVFVELRDKELKPENKNCEKCHFYVVSETHRLQPHFEAKTVRPNIYQ